MQPAARPAYNHSIPRRRRRWLWSPARPHSRLIPAPPSGAPVWVPTPRREDSPGEIPHDGHHHPRNSTWPIWRIGAHTLGVAESDGRLPAVFVCLEDGGIYTPGTSHHPTLIFLPPRRVETPPLARRLGDDTNQRATQHAYGKATHTYESHGPAWVRYKCIPATGRRHLHIMRRRRHRSSVKVKPRR